MNLRQAIITTSSHCQKWREPSRGRGLDGYSSGNTLSEGNRTFTYNQSGHLKEARVNGTLVGTYTYNYLNQRTRKVTAEGTVLYHYGINGELLLETDQHGATLRRYVYIDGIPIAQIDVQRDPRPLPGSNGNGKNNGNGQETVQNKRPAMPEQANRPGNTTGGSGTETIVYLHTDHLGTPRLATDANGVKVWAWDGEAFGTTSPNEDPDGDGNKVVVPFGLSNGYRDKETKLTYVWNRYLMDNGRWLTSDPIGLAGGPNTYLYANANPLRFIDPNGLASLVTDMAGGATTFDPRPEDPHGVPTTIPTLTRPDSRSEPGAGDPYSTPDINCLMNVNSPSYGPFGAYIDTGDPRGRDIHGGGSSLPDWAEPQQSRLTPTRGCTRGYNQDIKNLCDLISDFKGRHPGTPIPYSRQ